MEQFKQVLKGAGMSDEDITALSDIKPEALKDFKADDYITKVRTAVSNVLANDNEFLKTIDVAKLPAEVLAKIDANNLPEAVRKGIEAGQYGRFMNEAKDFFQKQLNVDISKFSEEDQKSLKGLLQKATSAYGEGLSGGEPVMKELQKKLQESLAKYSELETDVPNKIKTATDGERNKFIGKMSTLIAKLEIGNVKGLKVKPDLVVPSVLQKLNSEYTLAFDEESMSVTLMQKANPLLKALETDGKEVSLQSAIAKILKAEGAIDEKAAEEANDPTKKKIEINGDNLTNIPGSILDKMKANAEKEGK